MAVRKESIDTWAEALEKIDVIITITSPIFALLDKISKSKKDIVLICDMKNSHYCLLTKK